ncbi:MAG: response regulator [Clostridia bacterium]|nr:response regulator [Clostridia bacterium]
MKIIVVDDELSALNTFLPNVVDSLNVECKMFMNAPRSALEYVRINKVDAAFLDIKMPEIDGIDLAERMLDLNPEIKIVFISAYAKDEEQIRKKLNGRVAGFCHKPYRKETLSALIAGFGQKDKPEIFLKTFDAFDLFINGVAVDFSSRKAKELLALLTDARGSYVSMDTAIGNLWADKPADLGKRLYRDAVCRLRLTLKEKGAEELVTFERARTVINTGAATCDMWDFIKNGGIFSGRYMPQYDWSIITESMLEQLKNKK